LPKDIPVRRTHSPIIIPAAGRCLFD
jgi:hypothetical protein